MLCSWARRVLTKYQPFKPFQLVKITLWLALALYKEVSLGSLQLGFILGLRISGSLARTLYTLGKTLLLSGQCFPQSRDTNKLLVRAIQENC